MKNSAFGSFNRPSANRVPGWIWLGLVLLAPAALIGPNAGLGFYALLVLSAGLRLLWRSGEPPILLFIFLYQWVQSATGAIYGNVVGEPLSDSWYFSGRHEFASALMLSGTLILAMAMSATAGYSATHLNERISAFFGSRPFGYWFRLYCLTFAFGAASATLAPLVGGLAVPLLTLAGVKWAGFILLTFAAFSSRNPRATSVWAAVFALEFALSIGGFFASFKDVFVYSLLGLAVSNVKFGARILVPGTIIVGVMIGLSLVWSAVKSDYRAFANAGTGQQVVLVDYGQRVGELSRLIGNLDNEKLLAASQQLIERLMYHNYFGAVAENVPQLVPHAEGAIWGEAISRPFMPRILFPNKASIHDSELTNHYSGVQVATAEQGASISLGYMAEAYIDFGAFFMFAPIAALGLALGLFYRWLMRQTGSLVVLGAALAPFALMPAHLAETSIIKMIPSLVLTFLVCIIVLKVLAPMVLGNAIRRQAARRLP